MQLVLQTAIKENYFELHTDPNGSAQIFQSMRSELRSDEHMLFGRTWNHYR